MEARFVISGSTVNSRSFKGHIRGVPPQGEQKQETVAVSRTTKPVKCVLSSGLVCGRHTETSTLSSRTAWEGDVSRGLLDTLLTLRLDVLGTKKTRRTGVVGASFLAAKPIIPAISCFIVNGENDLAKGVIEILVTAKKVDINPQTLGNHGLL